MASDGLPAGVGRPDGWAGYAPLDASKSAELRAAVLDLAEGLRRWRTWTYLAVESVKNQYRRTVLGPWWLTLQTAAYIVGIAFIFGKLQHLPLKVFLPYVALGMIAFNLLSGLTRAASTVFVGAAGIMKSTRQPLSNYVLRDVTIEFIQFAHNLVIYLVFLAIGLVPLTPRILITLPIVFLIAVNGVFAAFWLGTAVARFRDIGPAVLSILQVSVFFTPVFYRLNNIGTGKSRALLDWNPFTHFLIAFRSPLIGAHLAASTVLIALGITLGNVLIGLVVFSRVRSRLPYWVA